MKISKNLCANSNSVYYDYLKFEGVEFYDEVLERKMVFVKGNPSTIHSGVSPLERLYQEGMCFWVSYSSEGPSLGFLVKPSLARKLVSRGII